MAEDDDAAAPVPGDTGTPEDDVAAGKLSIEIGDGDELVLGLAIGDIIVRLAKKSGPKARLSIEAPRAVTITKVPRDEAWLRDHVKRGP